MLDCFKYNCRKQSPDSGKAWEIVTWFCFHFTTSLDFTSQDVNGYYTDSALFILVLTSIILPNVNVFF